MACNVCITGSGEGEAIEAARITTPRAKKAHKCGECWELIQPGQAYQHMRGLCEGEWITERTCLLCVEIRKAFYCGGGFVYGELWESMKEEAFPELTTASECFVGLSPEAKGKVMDRWRAWKGLAA